MRGSGRIRPCRVGHRRDVRGASLAKSVFRAAGFHWSASSSCAKDGRAFRHGADRLEIPPIADLANGGYRRCALCFVFCDVTSVQHFVFECHPSGAEWFLSIWLGRSARAEHHIEHDCDRRDQNNSFHDERTFHGSTNRSGKSKFLCCVILGLCDGTGSVGRRSGWSLRWNWRNGWKRDPPWRPSHSSGPRAVTRFAAQLVGTTSNRRGRTERRWGKFPNVSGFKGTSQCRRDDHSWISWPVP